MSSSAPTAATLRAPLVVDALGWRRVLADPHYQPPEAPLSRGLEVHPHAGGERRRAGRLGRALARAPRLRLARAGRGRGAHRRRLLRAAPPRQGADRARWPAGSTPRPSASRATGSRTACARRSRTASSASATAPATASRSRARGSAPPSTSASPAGASWPRCWPAARTARPRWRRYAAFHDRHAGAFRRALALQRLIPALPPRVLALLLRALSPQALVDRAFGWYLDQAHPSFAAGAGDRPPAPRDALVEAG